MKAQESAYEVKLEQRDIQLADVQEQLAAQERRNARITRELERCEAEGNGMREEVRWIGFDGANNSSICSPKCSSRRRFLLSAKNGSN